MKKTFLLFTLLLGLSFVMSLSFNPDPPLENGKGSQPDTPRRAFQVAIITPVTHPSLEQIQKGFCETLIKDSNSRYQFTVYNAQGSKTLMRSELEEIISKKYELIFAIGTQTAKMGKEVLAKKNAAVPLVFGAVPNPAEHYLVQSKNLPENFVTGVSEVTDYPKQLDLLAYLKPDLKSLLLVYDPSNAGLEQDKVQIEEKLNKMGVRFIPIEVFKTNEIKQKVQPFIHEADVVMILKDNTVVTGLETLVKLCQAHQTVLMASDLDSPEKGAGIGFGVKEFDYGREAAEKASLILTKGALPHTIPITPVDHFKLKVNKKSLAAQGLQLNPYLLYLIEEGEGI